MKHINFVVNNGGYTKIIASLINPILPYLDNYKISDSPDVDCLNVSYFVEDRPHRDVFISHGIADKRWRDACTVRDYDYVFVSGELWKQKLINQGLEESKIFVVGYTKLDDIFNEKYIKKQSYKKTILFAPTHKALPSISICDRMDDKLEKLSEKYNIISSIHPAIREDNTPTMQKLVDADIVISDSGSLVYEALALGKQVVFPDWLVKEAILKHFNSTFEADIYNNGIGIHTDEDGFYDAIEYALNNLLDEKTISFMEGILPKRLRGYSGLEHAIALDNIRRNL